MIMVILAIIQVMVMITIMVIVAIIQVMAMIIVKVQVMIIIILVKIIMIKRIIITIKTRSYALKVTKYIFFDTNEVFFLFHTGLPPRKYFL